MKALRKVLESWLVDVLMILGGVLVLLAIAMPEFVTKLFSPLKSLLSLNIEFEKWFIATIKFFAESINYKNLSLILGVILVVLAFFARVLWRMRKHKWLSASSCPKCEYPISRVKRTPFQKAISGFIPVRRFYCSKCGWKGIRLKSLDGVSLEMLSSKPNQTKPIEKIRTPGHLPN